MAASVPPAPRAATSAVTLALAIVLGLFPAPLAKADPTTADPCSAFPAPLQPLQGGQLHLNLDDCSRPRAPKGVTLDCTDPAATTTVVASVTMTESLGDILADLGFIEVRVGADPSSLPAFWQFQQGGCAGPAQLPGSVDFSSFGRCPALWNPQASMAYQYGGVLGPWPDGNRNG